MEQPAARGPERTKRGSRVSKLTLSFISAGMYESIAPLLSGAIQPEGIELITTYSDPSETF